MYYELDETFYERIVYETFLNFISIVMRHDYRDCIGTSAAKLQDSYDFGEYYYIKT